MSYVCVWSFQKYEHGSSLFFRFCFLLLQMYNASPGLSAGNSEQPDKLGGKSREWVFQIGVSLSVWLQDLDPLINPLAQWLLTLMPSECSVCVQASCLAELDNTICRVFVCDLLCAFLCMQTLYTASAFKCCSWVSVCMYSTCRVGRLCSS